MALTPGPPIARSRFFRIALWALIAMLALASVCASFLMVNAFRSERAMKQGVALLQQATPESLQDAVKTQIAMSKDARWAAPYFWVAFTLQRDWT